MTNSQNNSAENAAADLVANAFASLFGAANTAKAPEDGKSTEAKEFDPASLLGGLQGLFSQSVSGANNVGATLGDFLNDLREDITSGVSEQAAKVKAAAETAAADAKNAAAKKAHEKKVSLDPSLRPDFQSKLAAEGNDAIPGYAPYESATPPVDETRSADESTDQCDETCYGISGITSIPEYLASVARMAANARNIAYAEHMARPVALPIDVTEVDDTMIVKAMLPGVTEDEITVKLTDNILTINVTPSVTDSREQYLHNELAASRNSAREVFITDRFDADSIVASLINGVLTVSVGLVRGVTRNIEIKTDLR